MSEKKSESFFVCKDVGYKVGLKEGTFVGCKDIGYKMHPDYQKAAIFSRALNKCSLEYHRESKKLYQQQSIRDKLEKVAREGKTEYTFIDAIDPCIYNSQHIRFDDIPVKLNEKLIINDVEISTRFDLKDVRTKMEWPKGKMKFDVPRQ